MNGLSVPRTLASMVVRMELLRQPQVCTSKHFKLTVKEPTPLGLKPEPNLLTAS